MEVCAYTRAQVKEHNTKDTGIWVTYQGGVYDVTTFVDSHPGGLQRIMLAAGGPLEPYWSLYRQHSTEAVQSILAKYRIGDLETEGVVEVFDETDPFREDPSRSPALLVQSEKPFNAETPSALIPDTYITPADMWFTRHHHPVPDLAGDTYRLEVRLPDMGVVKSFTLQELKTLFPKHTVTATIQCAGNRRTEFNEVAKAQGLQWTIGAISTAEFAGVRMRDLLLHCGFDAKSSNARHVVVEGSDAPFDASIPIRKALDEYGDVLLCYEMNGEPVPRDHGYPIRSLVPGHLGARNVKWVQRVSTSVQEASSTWQRGVPYKGFASNVTDFRAIDPEKVASCQTLPVQSAICQPVAGTQVSLQEETVTVRGYAWSGGGRGIVRVDTSTNDGDTWHTADIIQGPPQKDIDEDRAWAWTLWEAEVPIPEGHTGTLDICCKAVDTGYNSQPDRVAPLWNLRGILNNAWHHVLVQVVDDDAQDDV